MNKLVTHLLFFVSISAFASHTPSLKGYNGVTKNETPEEVKNIGIEEHLGSAVDLSLTFKDEAGETVSLQKYFTGKHPVMLAVVYYNCPNLCNFQMNGYLDVLKKFSWTPGKEFQYVLISMDEKETPELAAKKKAAYLKELNRPGAENGWHFLTGNKKNIAAVAGQVGFKFKWIEEDQQFAHAALTTVLSPEGKITRYLYGISPSVRDLRLAMMEATSGTVGGIVDRFVMFCFHYDANKRTYAFYAYNLMRLGMLFTLFAMLAFFIPWWWKQKKQVS